MKRPLFWIGFLYFLGLAAGAFMPFALRMGMAAILVAAILVLLILRRHHAIPVRTLAICLLFGVGLCVFSVNDAHFLKTKSIADGKTVAVVGTIEEVEREQEKRIYLIRSSSIRLSDGTSVVGSSTLRLSTTKPLDADLYDTVAFQAKLFLPKEGYHFDTLQYYRSIGVDYVGYPLMDDQTFRVLKSGEEDFVNRLRLGIYNMRQTLGRAIDRVTDDHEGVLKAMLVADTAALDEATRQDFIQSGMSHMLVVSGMHFSIITTMVLMLLRLLKVKRRLRYAIVMAFCVFLMALWSFTPSVMRAGIMMLMYCLSNIVRRQNDSLSSLGLALLIICLANPFSANNLSLQFSAMSTIGVIVLSPALYRKLVGAHRVGRAAAIALNAFSMSISATIFTLPVVLAQTGMLSLIGPLANTLAAFLLTPILLLGFAAMVFGVLPFLAPVGAALMIIPRFFVFLLIKLAGACAAVPYASIYIKTLPCLITILAIGMIWLVAFLLLRRVHAKLMVALSLLIALVSLLSYSVFYYNAVEVSVIQEDSSTSVVVNHNHRTAVYTDAKESYLLRQFLNEKGVRKLDLLVVFNPRESMVKNLQPLLSAYPVETMVVENERLADVKTAYPSGAQQYLPLQTETVSMGGVQMVLYQDQDFYALGLQARGKRLLSLWEDYDITKVGAWYTQAQMVFVPYLPDISQCRQTNATLVRLNTTGMYYAPPQGINVLDFYRVFTLIL